MPAPRVLNEGAIDMLTLLASAGGIAGWRLDLYVNNLNPVRTNVLADFTLATFAGYAQATPSMGTAALVGGFVQWADSAARSFTPTATGGTVYGWVVSNSSTGKAIFCQQFDTPLAVTNAVPITVTAWFDTGDLAPT
jgi:hypothetical protein